MKRPVNLAALDPSPALVIPSTGWSPVFAVNPSPGDMVLHEARVRLPAPHPQRPPTIVLVDLATLDAAREAMRTLIRADRALDAAHDALAAAKQAEGKVGVGTFHHQHPLVAAIRRAKAERAHALARFAPAE